MRNIHAALLGAVLLLAAGRANAITYNIEFSYSGGGTTGTVYLFGERVARNAYLAIYGYAQGSPHFD
jgi:hypothetical protein